jgi:hypothetical protein
LEKGVTCPVCRKPINEGSATDSGEEQPRPSGAGQNAAAADWLATDLAFRLAVLQGRYPSYITPSMVDTWSTEAETTGVCVYEW